MQSKKNYEKEKELKRHEMEERKKKLDARKRDIACKRKAKEMTTRLAKKARLDHKEKMMKATLKK